jgi:hypothetical protein
VTTDCAPCRSPTRRNARAKPVRPSRCESRDRKKISFTNILKYLFHSRNVTGST